MEYKDFNDYELLNYISEGSEDANNILIKKYEPLINKIALKMLPYCKNNGLDKNDLIPSSLVNTLKDNLESIDKNEVSSTIQYFGSDPESYSNCWYYEESRENGESTILFVDAFLWDKWVSKYSDKESVFANYDKNKYPIWLRIAEGLFSEICPYTNDYYEERKLLLKYGLKTKGSANVKSHREPSISKGNPDDVVAKITDVYKMGPCFLISVSLYKTVSKGDRLSTKDKDGNIVTFTVDHIESFNKILESANPDSNKVIALATNDCKKRPEKGNDIFALN